MLKFFTLNTCRGSFLAHTPTGLKDFTYPETPQLLINMMASDDTFEDKNSKSAATVAFCESVGESRQKLSQKWVWPKPNKNTLAIKRMLPCHPK